MERRILILRIAMILAFVSGVQTGTSAQDYVAPPVSISKDKVKIDGKVFYSHIVQDRQTLYSISKAYNVSIEDIYRYNPSVKENGLRKNDIINIPVSDAQPEIRETEVEQTSIQSTPVQAQTEQTPEGAIQGRHTVKWYEDLSSIAAKYNVTEEALMKANGLKDRKIRSRQVLIIPAPGLTAKAQEDVPVPSEEETSYETAESEEDADLEQYSSDTIYFEDLFASLWRSPVNATLILPFKATGATSSKNHMDFYSGVLLAAKEMRDEDIELHLNVFDIASGTSGISGSTLRNSDLIIGPVSPTDITQIVEMSGGCPVISPLDQRAEKLTATYENLIQVPASQIAQFTDIAQWIMEDRKAEDKVIVISEKEARQNDAGRALRTIIERSGITYTPFSYSILEGRDIQGRLEAAMTSSGTNRVVIASESEAFVNDAVRNLNLIVHNKFQVILYAPAKIRSFETIEVENFHNTSLHASLTYNIDYEDRKVQDFIRRYRAMFGTEPTQFAFQGYDIARYFVDLASRYGKGWTSHLEGEKAEMLQNSFMFRTNGDGGYVNSGIRRIIYGKDYQIQEVL